jgi:hypothetical protein
LPKHACSTGESQQQKGWIVVGGKWNFAPVNHPRCSQFSPGSIISDLCLPKYQSRQATHLGSSSNAHVTTFGFSTVVVVVFRSFPNMNVQARSNFSNDLAPQVTAGSIDVAGVTGVLDRRKAIHITTFVQEYRIDETNLFVWAQYRPLSKLLGWTG